MSLTIELREPNGSASAVVSAVGQQITLDVIGVVAPGVAGSNDVNVSASDPRTFGIGSITGSFVSSAATSNSTAVAGNLAAKVAQPFSGPGSEPGKLQDLNGDGNIDVGSNLNSTTTNDYWLGQSESEVTTGTVVGNTKQIILGTVTYTVTNLHAGGATDINYVERVKNLGYFVGNWFDGIVYGTNSGQGHYANEYLSQLSAGTPFVVMGSSVVVAPVANPDTASLIRNTPTTINVLANDVFDRPANVRSVVIGIAPAHGKATPASNGTILYTPASGYTGTDSFTYTVADTDGRVSNPATVSITVVAPAAPKRLTGKTIGTAGSYKNDGNTIAKATDGNLSNYFDGPVANGNWVGFDLGSSKTIEQIAFVPRYGFASRMTGGKIQISTTADFSTGVTTIYTISTAPVNGKLTTITLTKPVTARYVRYLSPNGSYGDICEFEVLG